MSLKSELLDILDFPHERESYEYYMEVHTLGGELECYHMTDEGKEKLATQILDLLDKSVGKGRPLDGKLYSNRKLREMNGIEGWNAAKADVRKVIKEDK